MKIGWMLLQPPYTLTTEYVWMMINHCWPHPWLYSPAVFHLNLILRAGISTGGARSRIQATTFLYLCSLQEKMNMDYSLPKETELHFPISLGLSSPWWCQAVFLSSTEDSQRQQGCGSWSYVLKPCQDWLITHYPTPSSKPRHLPETLITRAGREVDLNI